MLKIKTRQLYKTNEAVFGVDALGGAIAGQSYFTLSNLTGSCVSESSGLTALATLGEMTVTGSSDGQLTVLGGRSGGDKKVENAHKAAVTCVRFVDGGNSIVTASADGAVKLWSRGGMLRSQLAQMSMGVHSVAVLGSDAYFTVDTSVHRKSLVSSLQQPTCWRAHDVSIVAMEVHTATGALATAGDDGQVKLWDAASGVLLSLVAVANVTSLAFCGEFLAIGSFANLTIVDAGNFKIRVCQFPIGKDASVFALAATPDQAGLICGLSSGEVLIGNFYDRRKSWGQLEAWVDEEGVFRVNDKIAEKIADQIIDFSVEFGVAVALTKYQVVFFSASETRALVEELKTPALALFAGPNSVAVLDANNSLQIIAHDKRKLASIKTAKISKVALAADLVAVLEDAKTLKLVDALSGKLVSTYKHALDIKHMAFSAGDSDKMLAFVDFSKELWICRLTSFDRPVKLTAGPVEFFRWNGKADVLATVGDLKFSVFLNPGVIFVDASLVAVEITEADDCGAGCRIVDFNEACSFATVRKSDGSLLAMDVNPHVFLLLSLALKGRLSEACRFCRFLKQPHLWRVLAGVALRNRDLVVLQAALTALTDIPKLEMVSKISSYDKERQVAELLLLSRRADEAVSVLLAAKRIFRALKTLIKLHRWEAALDLALQHQSHVDTVLAYRARWLETVGESEVSAKFSALNGEVGFDWTQVQSKVRAEKDKERTLIMNN